jgi:uncharacterized membrane protein HdeD (DUF308 family)
MHMAQLAIGVIFAVAGLVCLILDFFLTPYNSLNVFLGVTALIAGIAGIRLIFSARENHA